jgi:hypothetical protein
VRWYHRRDSNPYCTRSKRVASCRWATVVLFSQGPFKGASPATAVCITEEPGANIGLSGFAYRRPKVVPPEGLEPSLPWLRARHAALTLWRHWSGWRESNPHRNAWKACSYHYTTSAWWHRQELNLRLYPLGDQGYSLTHQPDRCLCAIKAPFRGPDG